MNRLIKISFLTFIILSAVIGGSIPHYEWRWQNPWPSIHSLRCVDVVNDSTAFVGSNLNNSGGALVVTRNRGKTWERICTGSWKGIASIQSRDDKRIWYKQDKDIFRSDDGGDSWILVDDSTGVKSDLNMSEGEDFRWLDSLTGWADNGRCITIDGGLTWNDMKDCKYVYEGYPVFMSVANVGMYYYFTKNNGIMFSTLSPDGHFLWTDDGGDSCYDMPVIESGTNDTLNTSVAGKIFASGNDDRTCWFLDFQKTSFTSDAGNTWTMMPSYEGVYGGNSTLYDATFIDSLNGWVLASDTFFAQTTDGGKSWQKQNTGYNWAGSPKPVFRQMDFSENRSWGVAVGNGGFMTNTVDSGKTWQPLHGGSFTDWNSIVAFDTSTAIVAGYDSIIYRTVDGGTLWDSIVIDADTGVAVTDMIFHDSLNGIACGYNGKIWKTADGGLTWQKSSVGTDSRLVKMVFYDELKGWVTGENSTVYYTSDGGSSWESQVVDTQSRFLVSIDFRDSLVGIVGSSDGYAYKTSDGGKSWNNVLISGAGSNLKETCHAGNGYWYIAQGSTPRLYKSVDNGDTWENVYYGPLIMTMNKFIPIDSITLLAASEQDPLYTNDGGWTWHDLIDPVTDGTTYSDLVKIDNILWGVGNRGSIVKFYAEDSSIVATLPKENILKNSLSIESVVVQGSLLNISWYLKDRSSLVTEIELFNMLGKKIRSLNVNSKDGKNSTIIDAGGIASGIYQLRIKVKGKSIQKMISIF